MSTAQAAFDPVGGIEGRRVSPAAAMWNLFVKEIRESRSVLIVGVFAFWLAPVFVGLIAYVAERNEGLQVFVAIAYTLLLSGGWLFAASFGTHIVCRDWGRAEEHFLLAQPVTPRWVVGAKLLAAITVIGLTIGCLLAIVHVLIGAEARRDESLSFLTGLIVCMVGVSLVLSLSIAIITRQTSASLVLTMLIMALGIAAPLVSTRFSFLHPNWDLLEGLARKRIPGRGLPWLDWWRACGTFLVCVTVCVVGSLTAAFVLCTRERAIRIGHKPLAWTVALAALLLFGAGMMEVGQAVEVRDRVMLWGAGFDRDAKIHCSGGRGYAAATSYWGEFLSMADFGIGTDGRLQSLRCSRLALWPAGISRDPGIDRGLRLVERLETSARDKDHYRIVGLVSESGLLGSYGLCRLEVKFDERGQLKMVSSMLAGEESDAANAGLWELGNRAWTDRYAYLLYIKYRKNGSRDNGGADSGEENTRRPEQTILRVYDWSAGSRAAKALDVILPTPCFFRCTTSSIVFHRHRFPSPIIGVAPLDDLRAIEALFSKGMPESRDSSSQAHDVNDADNQFAGTPSRSGWMAEVVVRQERADFRVKADQKGLLVTPVGDDARAVPQRALQYSPLQSALQWGGGEFQVVDSTLLAQRSSRSLRFYDLSDPFHARCVGFLNVSSTDSPAIERAGDYLLVLAGGDLTVVKRPKTRRAGAATLSAQAPSAGG